MARCPFATWRPVARYQPGGTSHVFAGGPMRRLVFHTAVSNSTPSMHPFFAVPGRATPHFYLGRDGELEQYIDTNARSTANLEGNPDCITVETWDGYPNGWLNGSDVPPWTSPQLESLAKLAAWSSEVSAVSINRLVSSRSGTIGIGWHRLGIDGNFPTGLLAGRVAGGELWSSSGGKVCPGDRRILQIPGIIERAELIQNGDAVALQEIEDKVTETLNLMRRQAVQSGNRHERIMRALTEMLDDEDQIIAATAKGDAAVIDVVRRRDAASRQRNARLRAELAALRADEESTA